MPRFSTIEIYERYEGQKALLATWEARYPDEASAPAEVVAYMNSLRARIADMAAPRQHREKKKPVQVLTVRGEWPRKRGRPKAKSDVVTWADVEAAAAAVTEIEDRLPIPPGDMVPPFPPNPENKRIEFPEDFVEKISAAYERICERS